MRTGFVGRYANIGAVASMLAAAAVNAKGIGIAVRSAFDDFASAAAMLRNMPTRRSYRTGRGVRNHPRGRPGWIAPYATQAYADRAVRRAERWQRANPTLSLRDDAPSHIYRNLQHASHVMPAPAQ